MATPYQPEDKLIQFLDSLDEESSGKSNLEKRFPENIDLERGKSWHGHEAPMFLFNIIESAIDDFTGKLSETRPKINVLATRDGLDGASELIKGVISSIWDRNEVEYKTERLAKFMSVAGVGFVGTPYNRALLNGVGDVDFVVKDPRMCSVDIGVFETDKIDHGEYVIIEDLLALDGLRSMYPGRAAAMKPDERASGFATLPGKSAGHVIRGAFSRLFKGKDAEKDISIPISICSKVKR